MTEPSKSPDTPESPHTPEPEPFMPDSGTVVIDCDDCAVRGVGCQDCVVSVLLGVPDSLLDDERKALEVLADVGLAPRLRLVPIHRHPETGGNSGAA